ncbi:hypothetical protein ASE36_17610 [Rhizobium sp. Root274]|nr:hypothetical protein ASC71_17635 [Rhizobium sp. Root1240]KRD27665.1 hypothetical protein ASE36_17610 [Rhizobium sp. Root274]
MRSDPEIFEASGTSPKHHPQIGRLRAAVLRQGQRAFFLMPRGNPTAAGFVREQITTASRIKAMSHLQTG